MSPITKRSYVIIAVCVLIILVTAGHAAYVRVWTSGYVEGYQAALNARDAELTTQDKRLDQTVRFLFDLDNQWIEKIKGDCLKWKPKRPVVLPDPLTMQ